MTTQDLQALRDAAHGRVLFHNGLWGAPTCYMWADANGHVAGRVPTAESESLDRLGWLRLAVVRSSVGATDAPVEATEAGLELLSSLSHQP